MFLSKVTQYFNSPSFLGISYGVSSAIHFAFTLCDRRCELHNISHC